MDAVPRETAVTPATPAAAREVFPPGRMTLAERYAALLATEAVTRGLVGPREPPRLWERHLLGCAVLARVVPAAATVADLGSGAGLPGVVLAIARPDLTVTLVEPLLRRARFLEEVVGELGLDRVEVLRSRAEDLHGRRTFEVVASRAVAPLDRLLGWSMPLVAPGGRMLAMKGAQASQELSGARGTVRRLGCADPELVELSVPGSEDPIRLVCATW